MVQKEKSMMKGKIIVISVIILLLIAGIVLLLNIDTSKDNTDSDSAEENVYTIMQEDANSVSYIDVISSDGTIRAVNLGDAVWTINDMNIDDVDTAKAYSLASTVTSMTSKNKVADAPSDLAQYGLDTPKIKVVITKKDGTESTIKIGAMSPTLGEYFIMKDNDSAVYTIYPHKVDTLKQPLIYYQEFNRFSVNIDDITEIRMTRSDEIINIRLIDEITDKTGNVWEMTLPYQSLANDDYIDNKILEPIGNLRLETPVDISDDSLFEGASVLMISVTPYDRATGEYSDSYNEIITVGKANGEYTYVKYKNKAYTVPSENIKFIKETSFNIVSKLQALVDITNVQSLTVEYGGEKHVMDIEHKDYEFAFKLDGNNTSASVSQNMYKEIISLPVDAIYNGAEVKETVLKLTYNGKEDTVVEFKTIDDLNCAVIRNGKVNFTIKKSKVAELVEKFSNYVNNPNE